MKGNILSTNYYLYRDFCKCCGKPKEKIHIGKYSCGWRFLFEQNSELQKYNDLERFLDTGNIVDEYGESVPKLEFLRLIQNSLQFDKRIEDDVNKVYHDGEYEFTTVDFS